MKAKVEVHHSTSSSTFVCAHNISSCSTFSRANTVMS